MPSIKPMRYAHCDGYTDVCYDDSGRYILTCGGDGDVRIWDGIDDDNALSVRCGDVAYALAYKDKRFFVGTDSNTIQAFKFPDGAVDGILTRFTAPANNIVLNSTGTTLAAGASDFSVKVVDVSNSSHKTCHGHEAPVLSVALDPKEEYLASSSCDGTVRIWKLQDHKQVQSLNLLPKCSDTSLSKTVCRMVWDQEGKVLFVPVGKEIHMYERETWNMKGSITDDTVTEHISVLAMSPDGRYLLAGSSDGWLCVYDIKSMKCVDRQRNERGYSITSLAWNPLDNKEVAFCDNQGQLGLMTDISLSAVTQSTDTAADSVPEGVFDDDDDFLIQATNDKTTTADSDIDDNSQLGTAKPLISDDEGDSVKGFKKVNDDDDASSIVSDRPEPVRPVVIEGYKPTPLQRAFQSGSTPRHLSSRYMVWNAVGIVKQYNTDEENSIDIEFHDTSIHHAMHVTNNFNYTMADLSSEAVILASEMDSETPSKLTCMHFSSWDNSKEWNVTMPAEEEIECVTLGEGWVAVATSTRNVRIFSITGIQKEMFSVPGPIVCMAGHTSQLSIVYHRGMGIPGEQSLGVSVLDVRTWRNELKDEPLPLSKKSVLSWLGFSAEGTPFCMDSDGIVRMLNRQAARTWIQVANTRENVKGKSDHNWIVGIHENPQQIRCIPCKGSRYPPTLPRPAVTVLAFQIPLCEPNTEKSQYEELLWRTQLMSGHFDVWDKQGYEVDEVSKTEARKPVQEALMKLFALSARSEREYRALEVCDMMTDQHTLQLAVKYSSRMRYMNLAEKISELAVRKVEEEETKQYAQSNDNYEEEIYTRSAMLSRQQSYQEEASETLEEQENRDVDMEEEEESGRSSGPMLAIKNKESKAEKLGSMAKLRGNPFKVSNGTPHPTAGLSKGTQVFDSLSKKKEKPVLSMDSKSSSQKAILKVSQPKLFMKKDKKEKTSKPVICDTNNQNTSNKLEKTPSAFELWMEENKDRLREENPEIEEEEFSKFSAEQFRALSKDERQRTRKGFMENEEIAFDKQFLNFPRCFLLRKILTSPEFGCLAWMKKAKDLKENKSKENTDSNETFESKKRKREEIDSEEINKKLKEHSAVEEDGKKKPLSVSTNSKLANFAFKKDDS